LAIGPAEFLEKPFTDEALLGAIERALRAVPRDHQRPRSPAPVIALRGEDAALRHSMPKVDAPAPGGTGRRLGAKDRELISLLGVCRFLVGAADRRRVEIKEDDGRANGRALVAIEETPVLGDVKGVGRGIDQTSGWNHSSPSRAAWPARRCRELHLTVVPFGAPPGSLRLLPCAVTRTLRRAREAKQFALTNSLVK